MLLINGILPYLQVNQIIRLEGSFGYVPKVFVRRSRQCSMRSHDVEHPVFVPTMVTFCDPMLPAFHRAAESERMNSDASLSC